MKGSGVLFSHAKDDWQTPYDLFLELLIRRHFTIDGAANAANSLLPRWWGPESPIAVDALLISWADEIPFINPPYSQAAKFVEKAAEQAALGVPSTLLVAARTDTKWFQDYIWDEEAETWRPGIQVQFIRGRVKFGNGAEAAGRINSAPFPSMIINFGVRDHGLPE